MSKPTIDAAQVRILTDRLADVTAERNAMRGLLKRALPMLVRLGDFIGNGPIDPKRGESLGSRCDLIHDIHTTLD